METGLINQSKEGFWRGKTVFITGAGGLLGSCMVRELLQRGSEVIVLLRDEHPSSMLISSGDIRRTIVVRGALEDLHTLKRIISDYRPEIVFHLAAQTQVRTAMSNPVSTFESNIKGTWNILESSRGNSELQSIIVASSDKAYGISQTLPYTEDLPLSGRYPYDASKSCTDILAQAYFHSYDLPVGIVRCGNLFGEGDLNFDRLIPYVIKEAYFNNRPHLRSNGKFTRDYLYVRDAAHGYLLLAEKLPQKNLDGEAFNFGMETPVTVLEMTDLILKLMGKTDLRPKVADNSACESEIVSQYLSCKKAHTLLKWKPRHTLGEGLLNTIKWYHSYLSSLSALKK